MLRFACSVFFSHNFGKKSSASAFHYIMLRQHCVEVCLFCVFSHNYGKKSAAAGFHVIMLRGQCVEDCLFHVLVTPGYFKTLASVSVCALCTVGHYVEVYLFCVRFLLDSPGRH